METGPHDFLVRMLKTASPSGFEGPIQQVVREYMRPFSDSIQTDVHGNTMVALNPSARRRVMLAGHCDQIGMLVTHIDNEGFIYCQTIGGWDPQQLVGQRMAIWTSDGPVPAVISRKPIHLLTDEERKQVVKDRELWLDIGAKDKDDAASVVQIGDPVTLALDYQPLRNGLASAPGMDDRTGVWVVMEALRRCVGRPLAVGLFAVSTVQEEIGLRGARTSAYSIDPHIGIAVDVTHATDCPTIDKRQEGDIALGKGPVIYRGPNMNLAVTRRLVDTARSLEIPFQISAIGRATPNDANSIQISRGGVATGLVSIPNRYMHSAVETISLSDIDRAADLLAHFVQGLKEEDDFTPV